MWKRAGTIGALAVAAQVVAPGASWAHHADIAAQAVCNPATGVVTINYTATSWITNSGLNPDLQRINPAVNILFNDVQVDSGAFLASNNYQFTGSAAAPAGPGPVSVKAQPVGDWADGFSAAPDDTGEVLVTLPSDPCGTTPGPGTGRFTGGGFQISLGGARITRGLTIHCDRLLSNNLEVNWGGNRFHMTEHLVTVRCSDDLRIEQKPPVAPLDTLVGVGTGRFNGADGYTIEFTLVDAGEPGRKDQAALLIYPTGSPAQPVLYVPLQLLDGGNLQAHYDQPHKK